MIIDFYSLTFSVEGEQSFSLEHSEDKLRFITGVADSVVTTRYNDKHFHTQYNSKVVDTRDQYKLISKAFMVRSSLKRLIILELIGGPGEV